MKIKNISNVLFITFTLVLLISPFAQAQTIDCDGTSLQDFFELYGGQNSFSQHSIDAVSTFIAAEEALQAEEYSQAKTLVDDLFSKYPKGDNIWWNLYFSPFGANIGTPHAYYGLRMIEDIANFRLENITPDEIKTAFMKVVVVGCSEGIQPTTEEELLSGTGTFVVHNVDPGVAANDFCAVSQSLDLFKNYVNAITKGNLKLEIEIIELPDVCMDVNVTNSLPYVASGSIAPVWDAINDEVKKSTDWWWIIYPSHVPDNPTFDDEAFITGGMGLDQKGGPAFIIDDKWIVRKPPHLGDGNYNDIERRIYLPQWLQHEFYHHLFRLYPELELEVNGHDWFDINFWPDDFEGQFEADYYAETLHKRLQVACVPMTSKLITRSNINLEQQLSKISMDELLGPYSREVIQNDWHEGEIIFQNGNYFWKNKANVQWQVFPNIAEGKLDTGADCPYPGLELFIDLYQNSEGNYISGVSALKFQSDPYKKRFKLFRNTTPIEVVLAPYESKCLDSLLHEGSIVKENGQLYWMNQTGELWSLQENIDEESFSLGSDSPTPDESFDLVMVEDDCWLHNLGFKYLDNYYWRLKRDQTNDSPILINELADLELEENFGSYSIDLSNVFEDLEGDEIFLFTNSDESTVVSAKINDQQLILTEGDIGNATVLVTAVDFNGGLVMDKFKVSVSEIVSTDNTETNEQMVSVFPNLTNNIVNIIGEQTEYIVSIFSANKSLKQLLTLTDSENHIDLSHLEDGIYFLVIKNQKTKNTQIEKLIKY